jgi:hypothetical protein
MNAVQQMSEQPHLCAAAALSAAGTDVASLAHMPQKPGKVAAILPQAFVLAALAGLGGCYVEAEGPPPPPRCGDAVWVRGHHDQYGD